MRRITKEMTLDEVLELEPRLVAVMMGFGMHCFSCPISQFENLEEAAMVHGLELDLLLDELNNMLETFESE